MHPVSRRFSTLKKSHSLVGRRCRIGRSRSVCHCEKVGGEGWGEKEKEKGGKTRWCLSLKERKKKRRVSEERTEETAKEKKLSQIFFRRLFPRSFPEGETACALSFLCSEPFGMVDSSLSRDKQAKVLNRISKLAPEVERATKGERV